jgi:signal peptidase
MSKHAAPDASAARRSLASRLAGLVLVSVLVFFLIALGPHLLGYHTATMLTGSMEPGISPGDVVVTTPKPTAQVQVGDVITYNIPIEDHRVETHRVTEVIHRADGTIAIRTKGDANPANDPWTAILDDDTVWETRAVVPELGNAIRVLRTPVVQHGFLWAAFGGLLLLGLRLIWGSPDKPEGDPTDDCTDDVHGDGARRSRAT